MSKKEDKIKLVLGEFKEGKLKSKVVNKKQAIAIALSEASKNKNRRSS